MTDNKHTTALWVTAPRRLVARAGAAALLALCLFAAGQALAQAQPATKADIAAMESRLEAKMDSEFALLRQERRADLLAVENRMLAMENRLIHAMINYGLGPLAALLVILPLYLLVLRRVLPGLFAPATVIAPPAAAAGAGKAV